MNELRCFIELLSIDKLTGVNLYALLEHFHSAEEIREADQTAIAEITGQPIANCIKQLDQNDHAGEKYRIAEKLGVKAVPYYSSDYPGWLKSIDHFPPVLFIRGEIIERDQNSIAVIGTRGATVYGKQIADNFTADFVKAGMTIVSGMARGIDTAAQASALRNNGRTIAVLGCGVDICYPPENRKLMEAIINNGAVISEFGIGAPPLAQHFPKRNRIVSGLARAVVAIEAKEKSGVMNTVQWALDQNRHVFAIPGNIFAKTSSGTNRLIKDGAIPVTSSQEVLEYLGVDHDTNKEPARARTIEIEPDHEPVWQELSLEPLYLDCLAERLERPTSLILQVLLELEIKGLVKQLPGMMFVKNFD